MVTFFRFLVRETPSCCRAGLSVWMPACFAKPKEAVRIDATVPTREIREALAQQEVPLPDEDGLLALSSEFNERLKRSRATSSTSSRTFQHASASWMDMFNELDLDHSGEITFDELRRVVRGKLSWPVAELPGSTLKALWCALDVDDSNRIEVQEMLLFLKGSVSGLMRKRREALQRAAPLVLAPAPDTTPTESQPAPALQSLAAADGAAAAGAGDYGHATAREPMRRLMDGTWVPVSSREFLATNGGLTKTINWRKAPVPRARRPHGIPSHQHQGQGIFPRPVRAVAHAHDLAAAAPTPRQQYVARPITSDVQRRRDLADSLDGRGRPGSFIQHHEHQEHSKGRESAGRREGGKAGGWRVSPRSPYSYGARFPSLEDERTPSTELLLELLQQRKHEDAHYTRRALEYLTSRSPPPRPVLRMAMAEASVSAAQHDAVMAPVWRAAPSSPRDGFVTDGHTVCAAEVFEKDAEVGESEVGPSYGDQFSRAGGCWKQDALAKRELEKERRVWRWAGTCT